MQDKVIVITGASSGIGEALAKHCLERGAKLVLAARRTPELAGATCLSADVSRRADNERIRDAALAAYGTIDVWVANAGRGISRAVAERPTGHRRMMQTNFKSVVYGIQAVLPHFKQQRRGQIIRCRRARPHPDGAVRSAYSAAKAAVNSIMTTCARARAGVPEIFASTFMPVSSRRFGKTRCTRTDRARCRCRSRRRCRARLAA